LHTTGIQKYYV